MLQASSNPTLSFTHRVAAWNALCASVDRCVDAEHNIVRESIWHDGLWFKLLQLYLEQSQYARPKSAKQLLSTLCSSWLKTNNKSKNKHRLLCALSLTGWRANDPRTKACLHALVYLLSKDVLTIDAVLHSTLAGHSDGLESTAQDNCHLYLSNLFHLASDGEVGSLVGQLVTISLDKYEKARLVNDQTVFSDKGFLSLAPIWAEPLLGLVQIDRTSIEDLRLYIFPVLFKRGLNDYRSFLELAGLGQLLADGKRNIVKNFNEDLLYAALQSGKELGLLYETEGLQCTCTTSCMLLPVRHFGRLLRSHSRSARLAGLSFLVSSHSLTRPYPDQSLRFIKQHLHMFMSDNDASFRSEVFTQMQKLTDRLRAITHTAFKRRDSDQLASEVLRSCKHFLGWLLRFLRTELRSTASYQHHISALRSLLIVVRSGLDNAVSSACLSKSATSGGSTWPFNMTILTSPIRRPLLDLLLDPFDDVRQMSFTILRVYSGIKSQGGGTPFSDELKSTIRRAEGSMLASGRADHADGVAHLWSLLYHEGRSADSSTLVFSPPVVHLLENLEHILQAARSNLHTAIHQYPLHGVLTSLRYIISSDGYSLESQDISHRLVAFLHEVWRAVHPVLCDDAPEGYTLDGADQLVEVTTKDVLSYCWRALKESSLLMATLVSRSDISNEQRLDLSELCFTQLVELRHRGAFSTVAQTWTVCCLRCADLDLEGSGNLLLLWYERIVRILSQHTITNTRRSAGIPSVICGLLIADSAGSLMTKAFDDFGVIASRPVEEMSLHESSLPQVHSLNCVKDILKNTRLGEQSERFTAASLDLAAGSLRSKAWAVRNCGLMLFRAVIDRLLGTSDTHLDGDRSTISLIPFSRHPELLRTVLNLLDASSIVDSNVNEGVFPALQLLQGMEIPPHQQSSVETAVFALTRSLSWHIRDKAARVYAAICGIEEGPTRIRQTLTAGLSSTNATHGALLSLKYLFVRHRTSRGSILPKTMPPLFIRSSRSAMGPVVAMIRPLYRQSNCPMIRAECIEIVAEWKYASSEETQSTQDAIHNAGPNGGSTQSALGSGTSQEEIFDSACLSESPIVRRSIARAFALGAYSEKDITKNLIALSKVDTNACAGLFRAITQSRLSDQLLSSMPSILASSTDMQLNCSILESVLRIADEVQTSEVHMHAIVDAISAVPAPLDLITTQRYADLWIQVQAIALDYRSIMLRDFDKTLTQDTEYFALLCCSAVSYEQESLCGSEAAVLSLSRIDHLWPYLQSLEQSTFQDLCFCVYDLLNDDDEDIRLTAAKVESKLGFLDTHNRSQEIIEPTAARSRLLRFSIKTWVNDTSFANKAFARAFGCYDDDTGSVAVRLDKAAHSDTALFAEEKQNLYIDESTEAKVWSAVILRLHPSALPARQFRQLSRWVFDGLDELVKKASGEPDGPLGWSTKPDAFVAGLQVICGAQILLHMAGAGRRLPVRPSDIRRKLAELAIFGGSGGLNDIWKQEIDRVLGRSIQQTLKSRARLLQSIARRTEVEAAMVEILYDIR